jgi:hypothetical protein
MFYCKLVIHKLYKDTTIKVYKCPATADVQVEIRNFVKIKGYPTDSYPPCYPFFVQRIFI